MRRDHRHALHAFERELLRRGRAPTTRTRLVGTARRFLERSPKPLRKLTRDDVRRYLAGRRDELSAVSQEGEVYRLRSFFNALVDLDLLPASPADGLPAPRAHRAAKPVLCEAQVAAMFRACEDEPARGGRVSRACRCRDRACLELLYGLGLRVSEACAVRLGDLSLADATLMVRPAKRGRPRTLPLPPAAMPALQRYVREARPYLARRHPDPTDHLLLAKNGKPLERQHVNLLLRRMAARAGVVGAHPHAFRHALASHLLRAGVSERAIQLLLGHARLTTTATYLAVVSDELRQTVRLLERHSPQ